MKLTVAVTRDVLNPEGAFVAQETETLEIDSVSDARAFEIFSKSGAFAENFADASPDLGGD